MYARPGVKNDEQLHSVDKLIELYPKLVQYCQFISQNKWDGEDLAQETMFKAIDRYQYKREMNAALLNKIAYNTWVDSIRKRNRETLCEIPEQHHEHFLSDEWIEKMFDTLTMKQATILTLKEAFHYKLSEIAEVLEMNETAIKSVLNRARRRLEKLMDAEDGFHSTHQVHESNEEDFRAVLYEALQTEDPTRFLRIAPEILKTTSDQPKMLFQTRKVRTASSPSCHLSMAA